MIHKNLILEKQPTGKVSEFFSYDEFTRSNYGKPVFNRLSQYLLECLCRDILDPVRREFGYPVIVSSGIRDVNVMRGLLAAGYHPSSTTDHSFGDPEVNPLGVGAADIRPYGQGSCEDIFCIVAELNRSNIIEFGQLLWERQGDREWVHLSNPKTILFAPEVASILASPLKIGYCLNGKYYLNKPW